MSLNSSVQFLTLRAFIIDVDTGPNRYVSNATVIRLKRSFLMSGHPPPRKCIISKSLSLSDSLYKGADSKNERKNSIVSFLTFLLSQLPKSTDHIAERASDHQNINIVAECLWSLGYHRIVPVGLSIFMRLLPVQGEVAITPKNYAVYPLAIHDRTTALSRAAWGFLLLRSSKPKKPQHQRGERTTPGSSILFFLSHR